MVTMVSSCIQPSLLAFGSLLLIVYLYVVLYMYLCGYISMCLLCMLYHCMLDMAAVMQSATPIGWQPSTFWNHYHYE